MFSAFSSTTSNSPFWPPAAKSNLQRPELGVVNTPFNIVSAKPVVFWTFVEYSIVVLTPSVIDWFVVLV